MFKRHMKKIQLKMDISDITKLSNFDFHGANAVGSHILAKYIGWTNYEFNKLIDHIEFQYGAYEMRPCFELTEYYVHSFGSKYRDFEYAVTRQGLRLIIRTMQKSANEVKNSLQIKQPRIAGGTVLKSVRVDNNGKTNKQYATADTGADTFFLTVICALFFFILFGQWFI